MSKALERVIAQQQREIDRLRETVENNEDAWGCEDAGVDELVSSAFQFLNISSSENRHALRMAIVDMGFCLHCQARPCECEDFR